MSLEAVVMLMKCKA